MCLVFDSSLLKSSWLTVGGCREHETKAGGGRAGKGAQGAGGPAAESEDQAPSQRKAQGTIARFDVFLLGC